MTDRNSEKSSIHNESLIFDDNNLWSLTIFERLMSKGWSQYKLVWAWVCELKKNQIQQTIREKMSWFISAILKVMFTL